MERVDIKPMKYSQTIGQPQQHNWIGSPNKPSPPGKISFTVSSQPQKKFT